MQKRDRPERRQRGERLGVRAQLAAELAAGLAALHVVARRAGGLAQALDRLGQLEPHVAAGQVARLGRLGKRDPRAHQQRLDRRHRRLHRLRDLLIAERVDLAQQQRRALRLGQLADVGDQRPELLAGLDPVGGGDPVVADHRVHRVLAVGDRAPQVVEAAVARDPVQPRAHVDVALVGAHRCVRLHEHLLEHVLGVLLGAQHVAAEGEQPRVVAVEEDLEGVIVATADQRDQLVVALQLEQGRAPAENAGATDGRCEG